MQAMQDQKELNEGRFGLIDHRWSRVEDAIRLQTQERGNDLSDLNQQIQKQNSLSSTLETRKLQMMDRKLLDLQATTSECKENLGQLLETEADFRVEHIQQKNQFIQTYTQSGNAFSESLGQFVGSRMGDLGKKLELVDSINQQKAKADLKQLKDELIGEVKLKFRQEKEKSLQVLKKVSEDSGRELEGLAALLKASQRQKQDNESRLRLMVANLNEELSKMCEDEEREGETTYDSLLRMLEHSCDQVQQAQLR